MFPQVLIDSNYIKEIEDYLSYSDKGHKVDIALKINKLNQFIFSDQSNLKFDRTDKQIGTLLNKLMAVRPGHKLLKYLARSSSPLKIEWGETCLFRQANQTIYLPRHYQTSNVFINEKGEKILRNNPLEMLFIHEAIHALHWTMGKLLLDKNEGLIAEELDNLEEQKTILGIASLEALLVERPEIDYLCENTFLIAFGLSVLRINHRGLVFKGDEKPSFLDLVYVGAMGDLARALKENPSLINREGVVCTAIQQVRGALSQKNILPLTAAVFSGREEVVHFLLGQGANPYLRDDLGGLLHAAVQGKIPNRAIVHLLMHKYQMDIDKRDHLGKTPLMHLIETIGREEAVNFSYYNKRQKEQLFVLLKELKNSGSD